VEESSVGSKEEKEIGGGDKEMERDRERSAKRDKDGTESDTKMT
jgi:hypothetical protein